MNKNLNSGKGECLYKCSVDFNVAKNYMLLGACGHIKGYSMR